MVRVYVGSLMTSLEMAGVSLTLLHMIPGLGWEELLGMLGNCTCSDGTIIITIPMP